MLSVCLEQNARKKPQAYKKKERIPQDTPAKYKDKFPFLKEVDSFALCNVQLQLEKAFKDHFRNRKQFKLPKFKKKRDKQSYTTYNVHDSIRVDECSLYGLAKEPSRDEAERSTFYGWAVRF